MNFSNRDSDRLLALPMWLQMMQKLRVDEPTLPCHSSRLLMFEELCLYPRVDSGVFSSVARRYGVFSLPIGPAPGTSRLDPEGSTLFDALGPLYAAALRSISGKLAELDQLGVGRGIERQWNILGVSCQPDFSFPSLICLGTFLFPSAMI